MFHLDFFIQFFRKQRIFAGMSGSQLILLNHATEDFNKELKPLIKQQKVEFQQMEREKSVVC